MFSYKNSYICYSGIIKWNGGRKEDGFLQLQYFLAVAEYKNFTKAARATYTSQPNISKQISQLEEDLGVRLFHRTNSGAELTMAGSYLYKGLSEQLPKLDRLFERTRELGKDGDENRIRLGLFESMDLERIIPSFFPKFFQAMESGIRIQIETYSIARLLEKLAVEDLDCVFFLQHIKSRYSRGAAHARQPCESANLLFSESPSRQKRAFVC